MFCINLFTNFSLSFISLIDFAPKDVYEPVLNNKIVDFFLLYGSKNNPQNSSGL